MKFALVTSAHWWDDPRIFDKYARSLAENGHEVTLVATRIADDPRQVPTQQSGVRLRVLERTPGRLTRATTSARRVIAAALDEAPDVFHLHDPELIPFIPLLRRKGTVVFDAHEDLPQQSLAKDYVPALLRPAVSMAAKLLYRFAGARADLVACASPAVARRFPEGKTVVTHNYPRALNPSVKRNDNQLVYVGVLSEARGALTMIEAMRDPLLQQARLELRGLPQGAKVHQALSNLPPNVNYGGHVSPADIGPLLMQSAVGLAILHPTPAHLDGLPTKLYEYMMAGIPAVVADFPKWREFLEASHCGLAVDPTDSTEVAVAVAQLLNDKTLRAQMGANAQNYAHARLSWESQMKAFEASLREILDSGL